MYPNRLRNREGLIGGVITLSMLFTLLAGCQVAGKNGSSASAEKSATPISAPLPTETQRPVGLQNPLILTDPTFVLKGINSPLGVNAEGLIYPNAIADGASLTVTGANGDKVVGIDYNSNVFQTVTLISPEDPNNNGLPDLGGIEGKFYQIPAGTNGTCDINAFAKAVPGGSGEYEIKGDGTEFVTPIITTGTSGSVESEDFNSAGRQITAESGAVSGQDQTQVNAYKRWLLVTGNDTDPEQLTVQGILGGNCTIGR